MPTGKGGTPRQQRHGRDVLAQTNKPISKTESKTDHKQGSMQQPTWAPNATGNVAHTICRLTMFG